MGCWNETCGITQMPICGGDPVRMFLLVEAEHWDEGGALYYSTDLWKPFGLPLKGTYDEYGRIENIEEDALSDLLLQSLKEIIVEVPNRMGDIFKREELTWETAIDFLTDEGLKVTDPNHISFIGKKLEDLLASMKEKFPDLPDNGWSSERSDLSEQQKKVVKDDPAVVRMYHVMVHEEVYQALVNYKVPSTRFSSWTEGNLRAELELGAQKYIADVRSEMDAVKGTPEVEATIQRMTRQLRRFDTGNRFVSATNHLTGNYGSGEYLRKYLDFVEKRINEGAPDDDAAIKILTDQFIDFVCLSRAMSLLRKMWHPQCGKGGQDREYVLHKYLGETIAAFSEKKMKEWDEEMAKYEDEDEDGEEEDVQDEQVSS